MIDEHGWTQKDPISDTECIIRCLQNTPCGIDKKQVERIINELKSNYER